MTAANGPDRQAFDLASALCARLCHDLASPLGALAGALEVAIDDPAHGAEALDLADDAARGLVQRLSLLRAAWAGDCGGLDRAQLTDLARGLPGRVTADLSGLAPGPFTPAISRLLLNAMLLAADALRRGGAVVLAGSAEHGVTVEAQGASAAWHGDLATALHDPARLPPPEPRTVQLPLVLELAKQAGMRLSSALATGQGGLMLLVTPLGAPA